MNQLVQDSVLIMKNLGNPKKDGTCMLHILKKISIFFGTVFLICDGMKFTFRKYLRALSNVREWRIPTKSLNEVHAYYLF